MDYRFIVVLFGAVAGLVSSDSSRTQLCEGEINLACLRNYFGQNGDCNVVETPNEYPVIEALHPFYMPKINTTFFCPTFNLKNIDGVIQEFYIDNYYDYLVISIEFRDISSYFPLCYIAIAQDGKEPKVVTSEIDTKHSSVTVTAALQLRNDANRQITGFSLKNAIYSTYVPNDLIYTLTTDPGVFDANDNVFSTPLITTKETYRTKASLDFLVYLQNNICDFGLDPIMKLPALNNVIASSSDVTTDEADISKLCEYDTSEDVTDCVRDYFEGQGTCTVVSQPDDTSDIKYLNTVYVPFLNISADLSNPQISGLNGQIEDVYINTKTNNLVMTVRFEALKISTSNAIFTFHEKGQSPDFSLTPLSVIYDVRITAMIHLSEGLTAEAVRNSFVTGYFLQPSTVVFGQNFRNSQDPSIAALLDGVASDPMTVGQEMFVTQGLTSFVAYLQNNICDYGISEKTFLENI